MSGNLPRLFLYALYLLGGIYGWRHGSLRAHATHGLPLDLWGRWSVALIRTYRGRDAAAKAEEELTSLEGTRRDGERWLFAGRLMALIGFVLLGMLLYDLVLQ